METLSIKILFIFLQESPKLILQNFFIVKFLDLVVSYLVLGLQTFNQLHLNGPAYKKS